MISSSSIVVDCERNSSSIVVHKIGSSITAEISRSLVAIISSSSSSKKVATAAEKE
jgi:hypothetical protein